MSDCYDVSFYKKTYYKDSEKVDMLPLKKGEVIVRMFPTEEDDNIEELNLSKEKDDFER